MNAIVQALEKAGYRTLPESFGTGRPDQPTLSLETSAGRSVVAKQYLRGGAARTFANMEQLWRSPFGSVRKPPGLPQPLECLAEGSVLLMERLDGRPLAEIDPAGQSDLLEEAIGLLGELHQSGVRPQAVRSVKHIRRSVRRKAAELAILAPESAPVIWRVVEALDRSACVDSELVPCHGDFSPRNVLVGPGRVSLIDWDRLQWADPARDVVYMGTWCWVWKLRQSRSPDWSTLERAVELYRVARPSARLRPETAFHVAAGLVRIAHSLAALWRSQMDLIPTLAEEALAHLR